MPLGNRIPRSSTPHDPASINGQVSMSSSPESPSRFIWEPRYRNPVTIPQFEALPSLHTPHMTHPLACHPNGQPTFGAHWQLAARYEHNRLLSESLQPRVVELDDHVDSFTDSPTAGRFDNPHWGANFEGPSSPQSTRSGMSPRTRALSSVAAIPKEHRYTSVPGKDVSPRQSPTLPPLRPQSQAGSRPTGISVGDDYPEDSSGDWTRASFTAEEVQDICLTATRRYLRNHLLNWRARGRRQRSVSHGRRQPPWMMRGRSGRAQRFHPYATDGWSPVPSSSSSVTSDGDNSTVSASSLPQRRSNAPESTRSRRRPSRPASLPSLPVSPTSSRLPRGRRTPIPGRHDQYHYEPLPRHDDEEREDDEDETLPPADSLLANVSDICTLIWQRARRQRLHVIRAEARALDDMADLLRWAEIVVFTATAGRENPGDGAAIALAAVKLCEILGDAIGLGALDVEDREIGGR